jgi:hypothetical protein
MGGKQYMWSKAFELSHNVEICHFLLQNTMTDSTILLEDVQKMKDKGEIAQAYIGLKETNR